MCLMEHDFISTTSLSKELTIDVSQLFFDPLYLENKKKKLEIYKNENFNLIELEATDINNPDDILTQKLCKYDIRIY